MCEFGGFGPLESRALGFFWLLEFCMWGVVISALLNLGIFSCLVFWSFVFWILWVFGVWNLEFGMLGLGILEFLGLEF